MTDQSGMSAMTERGAMDAANARLQRRVKARDAEIEILRAALKEIQAYSVGDPRPRHTWYYDRAESALKAGLDQRKFD